MPLCTGVGELLVRLCLGYGGGHVGIGEDLAGGGFDGVQVASVEVLAVVLPY